MVLCFTCSPQIKRLLDELVSKGTYSDYSDVITAAVNNLAVLDRSMPTGSAVVLQATSMGALESVDPPSGGEPNVEEMPSPPAPPDTAIESNGDSIPHVFSRAALNGEQPGDLPDASSNDLDGLRQVPLDKWVFGQFSKFLPAKATCRALANLAAEHRGGFDLNKISARIAADAAVLSDYLAAIDRREAFFRDDALVLGFPSNQANADRSRLRYATQYVGTLSHGRPWGMLFDFKLASLLGSTKVNLTEAGWQFAALDNPPLDENRGDRFSDEEIAFLLSHIGNNVRAEDFAYQTILRAIRSGSNTPQKLDRICQGQAPTDRDTDLSDAFVSTQRTGVISRMNELRLIGRRRDGIRVTYFVTDRGNDYLQRHAA